MASAETQTILQRKTALGKREHEARVMSIAKAMRQSIAKLGNELFEMPLSAIGLVTEDRKVEELGDLIDENALLTLLEGPAGRVGAAIVGPSLVSGLIQQQTMGRVSEASDESRPMTQTDAAMCAPLLDALFVRVVPILEVEEDRRILDGYGFGALIEDSRTLGIALDAPVYYVVRLTLDISQGKRQSELTLILPQVSALALNEPTEEDDECDASTLPSMNDVVMNVPAELNMVLCKLTFELADVENLEVGHAIDLPHNTFPETEITTETGQIIGTGTLGQIAGTRALRLKREPVQVSQPRRRQSDLADLDLPEIEALPSKDSQHSKTVEREQNPEFVVDTGADLPVLTDEAGNLDLEEFNPSESHHAENSIPELDDLPNLAELPDLVQSA